MYTAVKFFKTGNFHSNKKLHDSFVLLHACLLPHYFNTDKKIKC